MKEDKIRERILSTFSDVAKILGYSEIYGRIIACLLIHDKPIPLTQVAREVGYSTSMVSLSIDFLENMGMVKRIKKPGDRKLYLLLTGNLLEGLRRAILFKIEDKIPSSLREFEGYKRELKRIKGLESKRLLKALKKLEDEIRRMYEYVKVLSKIEPP